ncbi:MAG: preprotein translocase subunit SecE [bacterium JZ-2024 1]
MDRIRGFIRDMSEELAKVSWPPLAEALRATQAVIWVTLVSMAILVTAGAVAALVLRTVLG